jgi:hypothetical protein
VTLGRYAALVVALVALSLGALWPLLPPSARRAALAGAVLAAANTVAAYGLAVWSANRSTSVFMGAVLGGMVGRMGLMLAAVVAAVLFLGLPKVPLALSLLSYFVVFLVFELTLLHRRTSTRAEAPRA